VWTNWKRGIWTTKIVRPNNLQTRVLSNRLINKTKQHKTARLFQKWESLKSTLKRERKWTRTTKRDLFSSSNCLFWQGWVGYSVSSLHSLRFLLFGTCLWAWIRFRACSYSSRLRLIRIPKDNWERADCTEQWQVHWERTTHTPITRLILICNQKISPLQEKARL